MTGCSAASANDFAPSNCLGGLIMAELVYNLVKGPAGWVLSLDGERFGGVYGTKEAAFEAAYGLFGAYALVSSKAGSWGLRVP